MENAGRPGVIRYPILPFPSGLAARRMEWNGGIYWEDDNSDNIIHNNVATSETILGDNIPTTGNNNWDFGAIRSMNIFMENYENVEAAFDDIKHYVGEVLFFRALAHFNLVRNYGDVPWLDKSLLPDSEELQGERMARNVVIDNIMADLDNAIAYLVSGRNSGGNRLNRECASLLKARVALGKISCRHSIWCKRVRWITVPANSSRCSESIDR